MIPYEFDRIEQAQMWKDRKGRRTNHKRDAFDQLVSERRPFGRRSYQIKALVALTLMVVIALFVSRSALASNRDLYPGGSPQNMRVVNSDGHHIQPSSSIRSDEVFQSYSNAVLANKPALYWHLDESNGTVATDASGQQNNGTYTGNVQLGQKGIFGNSGDTSAAVAGDSGYVDGPQLAALQGSHPRTVEVWFRTTSNGNTIFHVGSESAGNAMAIETVNSGGPGGCGSTPVAGLYVHFWGSDIHMPVADLTNGNWHYVGVTYQGTTVNVVVDGTQPRAYLWDGGCYASLQSQPFIMPNTPYHTSPSHIGLGSSGLEAGLVGNVDEFAVYPSAIPPRTLEDHYFISSAASGSVTRSIGTLLVGDGSHIQHHYNQCTGSVVASSSRDVVLTAAHCSMGKDFAFAPEFTGRLCDKRKVKDTKDWFACGSTPLDVWTSTKAVYDHRYGPGHKDLDFGFVEVRKQGSRNIQDETGGLPIAFCVGGTSKKCNARAALSQTWTAYGIPDTTKGLVDCTGSGSQLSAVPADGGGADDIRIDHCSALAHGASGGPALNQSGYVGAVNSQQTGFHCDMSGCEDYYANESYLGQTARKLFESTQSR